MKLKLTVVLCVISFAAVASGNAQGNFEWMKGIQLFDPIWQTQQSIKLMANLHNTMNMALTSACSSFSTSYYTDPMCASYVSSSGYRYSGGYRYIVLQGSAGSVSPPDNPRPTEAKREYRYKKPSSIVNFVTGNLYTYMTVPDTRGVAGKNTEITVIFNDSDGNLIDGSFFIAVKDEEWKGLSEIVTQKGVGKLLFEIPPHWSGTKEIKATFIGFPEDWRKDWERSRSFDISIFYFLLLFV